MNAPFPTHAWIPGDLALCGNRGAWALTCGREYSLKALVFAAILSLSFLGASLGATEGPQLVEHPEGSVGALITQGLSAQEQGRLDIASSFYLRALERDQHSFPAVFNLGLVYQLQGDLDRARQRFLEALHLRPEHPEVQNALGMVASVNGDYREAAGRFSAAVQAASPGDVAAAGYQYNLAAAHERLDAPIEAQRAYLRCLDLQPKHFGARYNLGTLYLTKLDNLRQAESHLLEASRIDPDRPEPLLNLAVLSERRATGEAEAWYNRAIEVATKTKNPLSAKLLMLRAQFFDRQVPPQKVRMRIDLQELLKLDPDFPGANGLLGLHYETLGRTEDALRHLEREVQRPTQNRSDPIYLECLYRLARLYSDKEHNPTKSLQYATLYHRLQPDSPLSRDLKNRTSPPPSGLESPPPAAHAEPTHKSAHETPPAPHANPAQKIGHH